MLAEFSQRSVISNCELAADEAINRDGVPIANYRRFVSALLIQAMDDARRGDKDAMKWLHGPEALGLAEMLELPTWPPDKKRLRRNDWRFYAWRKRANRRA